jgi:protein TonB
MTAEPNPAKTRGRAAPAAVPGRLRGIPLHKGSGASTAAIAFSALLHGALAATVLMWPDAPAPHAVGGPVVVTLVTMAPLDGGRTERASGAPTRAEEHPASSVATTAGPATPPSVQDAPPEPESPHGQAATADLPLATASGEDVPASRAEPMPSTTTALSSTVVTPPPIPRPPRRPITVARAEPETALPPPHSIRRSEPAVAPPRAADGLSAAADAGERPVEQAAIPRVPADPTASAGGNGAPPGPTAAVLGAAPTGPRFAMGTALNPRPRYPLSARRRGLEGRVVLRVFVEPDGRVRSIDILESSRHAVLDDAAVEALLRWRFDPARRSGVPVASWIDVPVAFRLAD